MSPNPAQRTSTSKFAVPAGTQQLDFDLTQPGIFGPSAWSGKIIRLEIAVGGSYNGVDRFNLAVDWASVHRADVRPTTEPGPSPIVRVLSPSDEGGADYATVSGDPWDFGGADDIASSGDLIVRDFAGGNLNGTTIRQ